MSRGWAITILLISVLVAVVIGISTFSQRQNISASEVTVFVGPTATFDIKTKDGIDVAITMSVPYQLVKDSGRSAAEYVAAKMTWTEIDANPKSFKHEVGKHTPCSVIRLSRQK